MIDFVSVNCMRSLSGFEQKLGSGITVVYGPNGCGKTTILEAIHLLAQGFSFRAKDLKEAISWKCDEMILRGHFEDNGMERNRGIRVHRRGAEVRENGESLKSAAALFGSCPAVIMQPSDIELLRGAPDVRRHWLDEILCYRSAANGAVLRRYKRVLQQRNQWLKQYKKAAQDRRNGLSAAEVVGGEDLFKILTEQLIDLGAKLWSARLTLTEEMSPIITGYYRKLSGGVDEITCAYKSSILKELDALDGAEFLDGEELDEVSPAEPQDEIVSEESLREAFARKLAGLEYVEKLQGMTMAGPHRDDLAVCIGGYEMRSVGSQGQCRSAALAMRFAAVDVASRYLSKPILLLDDIFAELDVNRRNAVADLIREKECQVVIATPQKEDLPFTADAEVQLSL
ncbi:DNA replication/repair protein RecF [Fibrobacter sp. UWH6]|uniref:DNA replication/repair protein RecF n=2 Tax=Fibrobacter TaxID=832 RepID=UPI000933A131|nr:DNA replication and repair protein RecF [Fibrobacter sp. UWH6]MCQ2101247.1 DNA replication and repair protein RecF [Fibrobacter sp.]MDO4947781.1 DNA replication and repair protein RecF [Fibrobacter sp.]OWV03973.1 DNA replication and repair protein RecF [Fibrobacter sp. UWH3]OWV14859.1 DNA replication and repair protein RecF [Fibrobacter sp. UWH1]